MTAIVEPPATAGEYERMFERYVAVCNQAIEANKERFPYKEIWGALRKTLGLDDLRQCAVYDDRPKVIHTLRFTEDMKIKIIEKVSVAPEIVWPLQYSYLKHVVDNPQEYIEHPATLDWDILY